MHARMDARKIFTQYSGISSCSQGSTYYITCATTGTARVVIVLFVPNSSEVGVWITVQFQFGTRSHDEAFPNCSFEVSSNSSQGIFVSLLWTKCIPCTLVCGESYVRRTMIQIQKHPNHAGINDFTVGWKAVRTLSESFIVSRGTFSVECLYSVLML